MSKRTITAMLLAYLIPGAGHVFLRRHARGIAFFVIIMTLFGVGLLIDGHLYTPEGGLLNLLATIGSMGMGTPYFIARYFGPFGDIRSITYEYGSTFTLTAGLMNLLLVADAFDIAEGRRE
jgi:hypothetical protein